MPVIDQDNKSTLVKHLAIKLGAWLTRCSAIRRFGPWIIPYALWSRLTRVITYSQRISKIRETYLTYAQSQRIEQVADGISREAIISVLSEWGLDIEQVNAGSMPEEDLEAIAAYIERAYDGQRIIAVHVGNFVGVSLAYLASRLKKLNVNSVIICIDPNLPHRGIFDTEGKVTKLLRRLQVQDVVIRVTGYSLYKSISNDGIIFHNYDPYAGFGMEDAPEYALSNLLKVLEGRVTFVLLDGNHEPAYLREEVQVALRLLSDRGVVFIDDIDWPELEKVWKDASEMFSLKTFRVGQRVGGLMRDE